MPVLDVASRVGHSKASITLDIYGHLVPGAQAAAADKLGAVLHG